MDENNLFENNETTENELAENEIVENEAVEDEATENAEGDFAEEAEMNGEEVESDDETENDGDEENGESTVEENEYMLEQPKKSKKGIVAAIILIIAVVALGVCIAYNSFGNKYNRMGYSDVDGTTIGEICEQMEMDFDEFKEKYMLPDDMPESTYSNAASNMIPIKVFLEMYNTDFATFKESFHLPDTTSPAKPKNIFEKIKSIFVSEEPVEITEDTQIGIAQDEVELKYLVDEENMDEMKELYGFGDEVTGETKYKEVRPIMEKYAIEERKKAEKEEKDAEDAEDAESEDVDDADVADSSEDTDAAEEDTAQADNEQTEAESAE